jgi:hypothetical protein
MILEILAIVSLVLAGIPCLMFLVNLLVYRRPELAGKNLAAVSVLIPARNEEQNIRATLTAALANAGVEFEVIVLDDHSTDHTAEIVGEFLQTDARVRLETAPPLPAGWCGKQHACFALAQLARHPVLVFLDADVRLAPDALARMASFMARSGAQLASGVPRQELGTFSERLLIPLINFLLLGFLPMPLMRRFRSPAFGTGCGQLFVAQANAYHACGGHSGVRATLHDGLKLPKIFRQAGFRTDLFDATELAVCRMYRTIGEVWRGLGKNATEGLAAPGLILPMTLWLLGGQVLPLALLALTGFDTTAGKLALAAVIAAYLPRLLAVRIFRQPFGSAALHPLGIVALLGIQWLALWRSLTGRQVEWKGRAYPAVGPKISAVAAARSSANIPG